MFMHDNAPVLVDDSQTEVEDVAATDFPVKSGEVVSIPINPELKKDMIFQQRYARGVKIGFEPRREEAWAEKWVELKSWLSKIEEIQTRG